MSYTHFKTEDLIKEINRYAKKVNKCKTSGGLWALECGIKAIRSELDSRIGDEDLVTKMILEGKE